MDKFTNQGALTIITEVKKGETDNLKKLLSTMNVDVETNKVVPFLYLTTVHFARFVLVEKLLGPEGQLKPVDPFLVLSTNYDKPLRKHLEQLVNVAGPGLDQIYCHCVGYPASGMTRQTRLDYLHKHKTGYGAFHNGTVGLSVDRTHKEADLRNEIEDFIDKNGLTLGGASQKPLEIREEIIRHIGRPAQALPRAHQTLRKDKRHFGRRRHISRTKRYRR